MTQYPKNWTDRSVEKYVTQESQQKSRAEFEATHVPIDRIKIERTQIDAWADKDGFVGEAEFFDAVIDSHLESDNRMFFVVGETGSGKSELCQWLEYNIQDKYVGESDDEFYHEPILIPRQVREPREVLQRLTQYLDDTELDEAKRLAELPPQGVLDRTTGDITIAFDKSQNATIDLLQSDEFKEEVRQNLDKFVNAFDDPSQELEFEPISKDKLESLIDQYPGVKSELATDITNAVDILYNKITEQAKESIKDMLFVGDLKETLRQLNERFKDSNRRPVLIIEDLTGFTIFQHDILSFFSDLEASNWDVVIGVTTGMNQKLVQGRRADFTSEETINDRIEARVALTEQTDDGSKTLFLQQEDIHIDLAQKYLTAIKNDADIDYTPPHNLSENELDDAFGDGLYPFNKPFLTRVYENLREDDLKKQTPRNYLKFVIEGLLTNENPPFEHADLLQKLGTISNTLDPEYHGPDRDLLKWYGEQTDDGKKYEVDERIPEIFDVPSDGWAPSVDDTLLCEKCGTEMDESSEGTPFCPSCETVCSECQVPMERNGEYWVCSNIPEHKEPIGGLGTLFKSRRQELLNWKAEGMDFKKTSDLEDGAERVIRYFHDDPTSLLTPPRNAPQASAVWWDKGSRTVPIHVSNGDEPRYRKVVISRELPSTLLLDLLRIGVYDEQSIEEHIEAERVDPQLLRWWADQAVRDLRSDVENDIEEDFGVTLDEIALFGKYLLNVLGGYGTEFSVQSLMRPLEEDEPDENKISIPQELNIDRYTIGNHRETLKGLFRARFHLRSNVINYPKLHRCVSQTTPVDLVDRIADITTGNDGVKLGATKSNADSLSDFLRLANSFNARKIATEVRNFRTDSRSGNLETARTRIVNQYGTVADAFEDISKPEDIDFGTIDTAYDLSDRSRPTIINKVEETNPEDFESTISELREKMEMIKDVTNAWEFLDAYHPLLMLTNAGTSKRVYNDLSDFTTELTKLEDALEQKERKLENEDFGIEKLDTTPFDEAKDAAATLTDKMEDGL
jgi:hypothetical protein